VSRTPYTIRKLRHRPGTLYLDFRLHGKRFCLALDTLDKGVAAIRARQLYEQHNGLPSPVTGRPSITQYLAEYRAWADSQKLPRTRKSEENALKPWVAFNTATYLDEIDARHVDRFIVHLAHKPALRGFRGGTSKALGHPLRPSTIASYIRNLRTVFSMAKRWKYLNENPFSSAPLPKVERQLPRIYAPHEIQAILRATAQHSPECLDVFLVYFLTGMRAAEALRLEWQDVKFDQCVIELRKTKGKKIRFVPMGPIVRELMLRRRGGVRPFDTMQRSTVRHRQRRFDSIFLSKEFKRMATIAGVKDAQLKRTRGTYATALLEVANVSLLGVQSIVGHADIETTRQHYFNPISADILQKTSAIDAMFQPLLPEKLDNVWITPPENP